MNAKYVLALVFALQVSMSLCEIPPPSQELVDKYAEMKTTFFRRMMNAFGKVQEAVAPLVEKASEQEHGQAAKQFIMEQQAKPSYQAFLKIVNGLGKEITPLVDTARTSALGAYQQYLRPHIGSYLNDGINHIKSYLDVVLPAE